MAFPRTVVLSGDVRVAETVLHQPLGLGGRCRDLPLQFRAQARTESDVCPADMAGSRALTVARRLRMWSHVARARAGKLPRARSGSRAPVRAGCGSRASSEITLTRVRAVQGLVPCPRGARFRAEDADGQRVQRSAGPGRGGQPDGQEAGVGL